MKKTSDIVRIDALLLYSIPAQVSLLLAREYPSGQKLWNEPGVLIQV